MATYLAHDALRLHAASLLANNGLCVNIEIKIWLLLGVNVDTAFFKWFAITTVSGKLKMRTGSAKMCRFCMALLRIRINTSVKLLNAIAR